MIIPSDAPPSEELTAALAQALSIDAGCIELMDRGPNPQSSTFASEIVTVNSPNHNGFKILCKFGRGETNSGFGHRGCVPYEAYVYSTVLKPLAAATPRFLGSYLHERGTWLFLEYLDGACRTNKAPYPVGLESAAAWIGNFHRLAESFAKNQSRIELIAYDSTYFLGWIDRAVQNAKSAGNLSSDFTEACAYLSTVHMSKLVEAPSTVIHGEYYPKNILYFEGHSYPIDWESAAVAVGEIDLAMLTDFWPTEDADRCSAVYAAHRWPMGVPADFHYVTALARVYVHLRWVWEDRTGFSRRRAELIIRECKQLKSRFLTHHLDTETSN